MTDTPEPILRVTCPACDTRIGTQCSINLALHVPFDMKAWAHVARVEAARVLVIAEPRTFA